MFDRNAGGREAGLLLGTGLFLLGLTAGSFWIADIGAGPGAATAAFVLGIATLKAHLVIGVYMEMHSAPRVWAASLSGFLLLQAVSLVLLLT